LSDIGLVISALFVAYIRQALGMAEEESVDQIWYVGDFCGSLADSS